MEFAQHQLQLLQRYEIIVAEISIGIRFLIFSLFFLCHSSFSPFLISWLYFNFLILCIIPSQCFSYVYHDTGKKTDKILSRTKNWYFGVSTEKCDRYFKRNLIQPPSLYGPDGARHLSFRLQLVLREGRICS